MPIAEQIKVDVQGAMRAGEKQRVGALRLVLSELQKAAKESSDDELTVLRRDRPSQGQPPTDGGMAE